MPTKNDPGKKAEIKIKENPHAAVMKKAPDEIIARAIHDALVKEHEKKK